MAMLRRAVLAALASLLCIGVRADGPAASNDDPVAAAAEEEARGRIGNVLAHIPPQCYTRTDGVSNPCWTCHTSANNRNGADDWQLQQQYQLNAIGRDNHWSNLFRDLRPAVAAISDAKVLAYVRQDNYSGLVPRLRREPADRRPRWIPDLDFRLGFAADGFARDGSGWRAYRYKPFPGTFWPTNGAADDAMIRLPEAFRETADGKESTEIYRINLAIVEAAVAEPDTRPDNALDRAVEPLSEALLGFDLDGDGKIGRASRIRVLPPHFAGAAAGIPVRRFAYPVGTEFLHSVRYLDPDAAGFAAVRMKELRYARKIFQLDDAHLDYQYRRDAQEQQTGGWPYFGGDPFSGLFDEYGWQLQAYIEQSDGRLRLQTREEHLYCMGCHSGIGVTVDGSFSLPRKPPGAVGWGYQRLDGIPDVPQAGSSSPEYFQYLQRVGGGDEYRENAEMMQRFFSGGFNQERALHPGPAGSGDIRDLILPSRRRALDLDKAYMVLVGEQSFEHGRDAPLAPMRHVYRSIDLERTGLTAEAGTVHKDGRLWLDWESTTRDAP
ncbi:MAG: hypothetical protein OSA97_15380 [Nevskia sp.]|nr:hypothetical protein [Nevskia sp.]